MLVPRNGTGKTTIINALSYALYGEALTKIRKENLINKTNGKDMLVTVEFEKEGRSYRIERGRKKNVLKFYINDIDKLPHDVDELRDPRKTQEEIERLLNMSLNQTQTLGGPIFHTESVHSLSNNAQREIIEQLLGITLIEKSSCPKEQQKQVRDSIP